MPEWFRNPDPNARARLVCLPYAGGGAADFRQWRALVPAGLEIQPALFPGREARLTESAATSMAALVPALADGLAPLLDRPYALFGFSMGSWVGFELVRELRRRGAPLPFRLFACARRAPDLADRLPPIYALPDAEFIAALQSRYNALPPQILAQPEILALYLPALRADFRLIDTYAFREDAPIDVPLSAWAGVQDRNVLRHELAAWDRHTTLGALVRQFPGGHFFLRDAREALVGAVVEAVRASVALD